MRLDERFPSLPYVAPFALFMILLQLGPSLPLSPRVLAILRAVLLLAALWFSRRVISLRPGHWITSISMGVLVFALWVAPDVFLPGWRGSWLFSNGLTGRIEGVMPEASRNDTLIIVLRCARAAILVPIIEELFWRAWLPRWLDRRDKDFRTIPLGQFTRASFWLTALLFATEHGSMWDVGLAAGLLYNWWMQRTRKLGDVILAHAVTNACLSAYVLLRGRWEYW